MLVDTVDMAEAVVAAMEAAMVDMAMDGKREKLMLNQKPTLSLKPMLTMDMVVMEAAMVAVMEAVMVAAMEVMVDMEDMDTDVESEVPLLKLMPKPMPTMDMVVMAEDMEVTVMEEDTV